jgi:hypothetical protein
MTGRWPLVGTLALGAALLAGCGGGSTSHQTRASASASPTPPPVASPAPRPSATGCDRLTYQQAISPTLPNGDTTVPCSASHTAQTYAVGTLSLVVDGHLLAVDSEHARSQAARKCPAALPAYLGGDEEKLRLSMLRAVWFTPTVAQGEAGADWYRCDVIALAGDQQLATMTGSLKGVLDSDRAGDWAMCGTAQPGTADFTRVPCKAKHSWKALETVPLPPGRYPGEDKVKAAGQQPCRQAGRAVASDALDYKWGYEWPTADQWDSGQTYGICWAPG